MYNSPEGCHLAVAVNTRDPIKLYIFEFYWIIGMRHECSAQQQSNMRTLQIYIYIK